MADLPYLWHLPALQFAYVRPHRQPHFAVTPRNSLAPGSEPPWAWPESAAPRDGL